MRYYRYWILDFLSHHATLYVHTIECSGSWASKIHTKGHATCLRRRKKPEQIPKACSFANIWMWPSAAFAWVSQCGGTSKITSTANMEPSMTSLRSQLCTSSWEIGGRALDACQASSMATNIFQPTIGSIELWGSVRGVAKSGFRLGGPPCWNAPVHSNEAWVHMVWNCANSRLETRLPQFACCFRCYPTGACKFAESRVFAPRFIRSLSFRHLGLLRHRIADASDGRPSLFLSLEPSTAPPGIFERPTFHGQSQSRSFEVHPLSPFTNPSSLATEVNL